MSKIDISYNADEIEHTELWLTLALVLNRLGGSATFTQDEVFEITEKSLEFDLSINPNSGDITISIIKTED